MGWRRAFNDVIKITKGKVKTYEEKLRIQSECNGEKTYLREQWDFLRKAINEDYENKL